VFSQKKHSPNGKGGSKTDRGGSASKGTKPVTMGRKRGKSTRLGRLRKSGGKELSNNTGAQWDRMRGSTKNETDCHSPDAWNSLQKSEREEDDKETDITKSGGKQIIVEKAKKKKKKTGGAPCELAAGEEESRNGEGRSGTKATVSARPQIGLRRRDHFKRRRNARTEEGHRKVLQKNSTRKK